MTTMTLAQQMRQAVMALEAAGVATEPAPKSDTDYERLYATLLNNFVIIVTLQGEIQERIRENYLAGKDMPDIADEIRHPFEAYMPTMEHYLHEVKGSLHQLDGGTVNYFGAYCLLRRAVLPLLAELRRLRREEEHQADLEILHKDIRLMAVSIGHLKAMHEDLVRQQETEDQVDDEVTWEGYQQEVDDVLKVWDRLEIQGVRMLNKTGNTQMMRMAQVDRKLAMFLAAGADPSLYKV